MKISKKRFSDGRENIYHWSIPLNLTSPHPSKLFSSFSTARYHIQRTLYVIFVHKLVREAKKIPVLKRWKGHGMFRNSISVELAVFNSSETDGRALLLYTFLRQVCLPPPNRTPCWGNEQDKRTNEAVFFYIGAHTFWLSLVCLFWPYVIGNARIVRSEKQGIVSVLEHTNWTAFP
jgi:hypothetical protein